VEDFARLQHGQAAGHILIRQHPFERDHQPYQTFSRSVPSIRQGSERSIAQIRVASGEQSQEIDQVNRAVSEMKKVIQQNAANVEEPVASAEELNAHAEQMRACMEALQLLVNGTNEVRPTRHSGRHPWTKAQESLFFGRIGPHSYRAGLGQSSCQLHQRETRWERQWTCEWASEYGRECSPRRDYPF
jgi:hypothetical protein